jgi:hypothetical protein
MLDAALKHGKEPTKAHVKRAATKAAKRKKQKRKSTTARAVEQPPHDREAAIFHGEQLFH